jgi:hypothetical protein
MCRAVTFTGAKREAASFYLLSRQTATVDVAGEDKVTLATRHGYLSKWVNAKEMK